MKKKETERTWRDKVEDVQEEGEDQRQMKK